MSSYDFIIVGGKHYLLDLSYLLVGLISPLKLAHRAVF